MVLQQLEDEYKDLSKKIEVLRIKRHKLKRKIYRERFKAKHGTSIETYYYQRRKQQ